MSAIKKIRSKITTIQSTQKITKAMQMVAISKMRKTQDKINKARPYASNIRRMVANLVNTNLGNNASSKFFQVNKLKANKVAVILITTDKGLCGSLNINVIKFFYEKISSFRKNNIEVEVCNFGNKGYVASNKIGIYSLSVNLNLGDTPKLEELIEPISLLLDLFHQGKLDAIYVLYSRFINTMEQKISWEQILPLSKENFDSDKQNYIDYIYEPGQTIVIEELLNRYIESVVYQCLADNMASEQASRMLAMKSATDNATKAIKKLELIYNKSRQAAITKELAEIVAGGDAV